MPTDEFPPLLLVAELLFIAMKFQKKRNAAAKGFVVGGLVSTVLKGRKGFIMTVMAVNYS